MARTDSWRSPATLAMLLALALCACIFLVRGPLRAADPAVNMDTPLLLAAAQTWRVGANPYDPAAVRAAAHSPAIEATLRRGQQAFVYSPATYLFLSPLTRLPWTAQRVAWNTLNTLLYLGALLLIVKSSGLPIRSRAAAAVFGIGLASNPGQICIALGQTGNLVLFLLTLSWTLVAAGAPRGVGRPRFAAGPLAAGLLAAAALVVKPQIALVYVAHHVSRGRLAVAAIAVLGAALLLVGALAVHGEPSVILRYWIANMRALTHADADPLFGSLPHQLINLQSPLAVLTRDSGLGAVLALAACAGLAGIYVLAVRAADLRGRADPSELAGISAATLLMLLLFYHRIYDAVFLMLPAALAVRILTHGDPRGPWLLGLLAPLWLPFASLAYHFSEPSADGFGMGRMTQAFLVQHQTWFLVAAFLLVCDIRRRPAALDRTVAVAKLPA